MLPIQFAGLRVEAHDSFSRPAYEHTFAGLIDYYGRRIGNRILEGSPLFFSRNLVERNDAAIRATAYVHYQQIPFDHRRCCNSPEGHFDIVLRSKILIPEDLPFGGIETEQMSHCAERVCPAGIDSHGGARPVTAQLVREADLVLTAPGLSVIIEAIK